MNNNNNELPAITGMDGWMDPSGGQHRIYTADVPRIVEREWHLTPMKGRVLGGVRVRLPVLPLPFPTTLADSKPILRPSIVYFVVV